MPKPVQIAKRYWNTRIKGVIVLWCPLFPLWSGTTLELETGADVSTWDTHAGTRHYIYLPTLTLMCGISASRRQWTLQMDTLRFIMFLLIMISFPDAAKMDTLNTTQPISRHWPSFMVPNERFNAIKLFFFFTARIKCHNTHNDYTS